ncbi:hypothetical protein [Actinomadura sp. DC4]|uniref:hypothetical protein n=1 Tax=Actinomadura sp. DC4 TaxID=3055069 RepID=UPI0025B05B8A|nr:hypothetical protein [Actinomadura sp. DC4]MDN3355873.1 hypothetical protein [Actinomadura sp. DC4]
MDGPDDEAWSAYLDLTRRRSEQLLDADDPYEVALQLMGDTANIFSIGEEFVGSMYALWGALTDWGELKPAGGARPRAESEMVRAAREWLALNPP